MEGNIGRRAFLKGLAAGAAALAAAPRGWLPSSTPLLVLPKARIRAPGDSVELDWPPGLDPASARLIHCVDGREVGAAPVPAPVPGPRPMVRLVAEPASGLPAGRHRFVLEAAGTRADLGGFVVAPFVFGC